MDKLLHVGGQARRDESRKAILSMAGEMTVKIDGSTARYSLKVAAQAAGLLLSLCITGANAAGELEIRLTNKASLPIVSFLFSEAEVNDFDGDTFANRTVAPGASITLRIPKGGEICTFDLRAEFDEDAERDPVQGRQDLCTNGEVVVLETGAFK